MNVVRSFVNYAIIRELCDRMRFEVDCAKSHHRVISEGLSKAPSISKLIISLDSKLERANSRVTELNLRLNS